MAQASRFGFRPVRHVNGNNCFNTTRMQKGDTTTDAGLIYVGDPVKLLAGGGVSRLLPADSSAAANSPVGIVARVYTNADGKTRTHGLPDQHPNISLTANADWFDVYVDPGIVYEATNVVAAVIADVGRSVNVTAGARVTAAGISGYGLDTAATATSTNPFRIVQISRSSLDSHSSAESGKYEVIFNNHVYKNITADI